MIQAWTPADVAAADAALIAQLPEGELMARAVEGLVLVVTARLKNRGGRRVVALVGPGNNGADALYAVAHLASAGVPAAAAYQEAQVHEGALEAARAAGVVLAADSDGMQAAIAEADLVLDGMLGIGGRAGLPAHMQGWVRAIPDSAYVIAVDTPSGQDPTGGALLPEAVIADETVTFSVAKPVHLLPGTEAACGQLTVIDIGLTVDGPPAVQRLGYDDVAHWWPVPGAQDTKYSRGVVGVVAGGEAYTGAAVLAVTAAVEAGAGMVRYVGTPTPTSLVRAAVPEAVMGEGQVQAWVIGPGLDVAARHVGAKAQLDVARAALASDLPVVLDAGGLDLLEGQRAAPTLLTPHAGEAARLLSRIGPRDVDRAWVESDPPAAAQWLAELTGCTVLLKGSTTLIASPVAGAPLWSQADAPPYLATAGAGDVLAGLAGMLLAAGVDTAPAGALAALVHGVAADDLNPGGPIRALHLAHQLPRTIAALLARS